jgi:hypothetical protein
MDLAQTLTNMAGFEELSTKCTHTIEMILAMITLVEHDHDHVPKMDQVEFNQEADGLRTTLLDLYRTVRHENFSSKEMPEIQASLGQIAVIYKPLLDQYDEYAKYHCLV